MFCSTYQYNNFDLSSFSLVSMDIMVWGICIGVILAVLLSLIDKTITSAFIRELIKAEAKDENSAKSLKELNLKGTWYLKIALNAEHKPLRRYLRTANIEAENRTAKQNTDSIPFYLPEENRMKAEMRFSEAKRPVFTMIFSILLMIGIGFFIRFAAPELMTMLDNFLTSVKG